MFINVTNVGLLWSKITDIFQGRHQIVNVTEMTISLQNWQIVTELIICHFSNTYVSSVTSQNLWMCLKLLDLADTKAALESLW